MKDALDNIGEVLFYILAIILGIAGLLLLLLLLSIPISMFVKMCILTLKLIWGIHD